MAHYYQDMGKKRGKVSKETLPYNHESRRVEATQVTQSQDKKEKQTKKIIPKRTGKRGGNKTNLTNRKVEKKRKRREQGDCFLARKKSLGGAIYLFMWSTLCCDVRTISSFLRFAGENGRLFRGVCMFVCWHARACSPVYEGVQCMTLLLRFVNPILNRNYFVPGLPYTCCSSTVSMITVAGTRSS